MELLTVPVPSPIPVQVGLICKVCRELFEGFCQFVDHKIEKHFDDFQNTKCFLFEERDFIDFPIIERNQYTVQECTEEAKSTNNNETEPVTFQIQLPSITSTTAAEAQECGLNFINIINNPDAAAEEGSSSSINSINFEEFTNHATIVTLEPQPTGQHTRHFTLEEFNLINRELNLLQSQQQQPLPSQVDDVNLNIDVDPAATTTTTCFLDLDAVDVNVDADLDRSSSPLHESLSQEDEPPLIYTPLTPPESEPNLNQLHPLISIGINVSANNINNTNNYTNYFENSNSGTELIMGYLDTNSNSNSAFELVQLDHCESSCFNLFSASELISTPLRDQDFPDLFRFDALCDDKDLIATATETDCHSFSSCSSSSPQRDDLDSTGNFGAGEKFVGTRSKDCAELSINYGDLIPPVPAQRTVVSANTQIKSSSVETIVNPANIQCPADETLQKNKNPNTNISDPPVLRQLRPRRVKNPKEFGSYLPRQNRIKNKNSEKLTFYTSNGKQEDQDPDQHQDQAQEGCQHPQRNKKNVLNQKEKRKPKELSSSLNSISFVLHKNIPYFIFPSEDASVDQDQDIPLNNWLTHQRTHEKNVILLDPDPTSKLEKPVTITPENPVTCKLCMEELRTEQKLRIHVKYCWAYNEQKHRYCVPCKRSFSKPPHLKRHTLLNRCRKKFKNPDPSSFDENLTLSDPDFPDPPPPRPQKSIFQCSQENCKKIYYTAESFKRHLKLIHDIGPPLQIFTCEICTREFNNGISFKKHSLVHSRERPYKCSYEGCTITFRQKDNLVDHERTHRGEAPFQCESCGKAYFKILSLKKHMRSHNNSLNVHQCHLCPRKFPGSWELKQHLLVHEKGQQFVCQFCGRKCSKKENLKTHEKTHEKMNEGHQLELEQTPMEIPGPEPEQHQNKAGDDDSRKHSGSSDSELFMIHSDAAPG